MYRALCSVYRALLSVYRALLSVYRALLIVYRALLSVYRALSSAYRYTYTIMHADVNVLGWVFFDKARRTSSSVQHEGVGLRV